MLIGLGDEGFGPFHLFSGRSAGCTIGAARMETERLGALLSRRN